MIELIIPPRKGKAVGTQLIQLPAASPSFPSRFLALVIVPAPGAVSGSEG